ncbi:putative transporter [Trachipleistophora hominis]|uniref:Putative transporter n=1 Tax=Trachipleistophora hominis TaxID=72359 RepID=L7JX02_TRAHO|nr:putative transporter [Trachipleistophora hominis]
MFLFFAYTKASILADILMETKKRVGENTSSGLAVLTIIVGLFILVLGISFKRISLTVLSSIFLTQVFWYISENFGEGYIFAFKLPRSYSGKAKEVLEFLEANKLRLLIFILIMSFIVSTVIISFIKSVTFLVLFIATAVAYTEGFHIKLLQKAGIDEPLVRYLLYAAILIVIVLLYIKIPEFLLAGLFCFIGSLMVTYGIDTAFKLEWNSLEVFSTSLRDFNTSINMDNKASVTMMVCFIFGMGAQFIQVLRIGGK